MFSCLPICERKDILAQIDCARVVLLSMNSTNITSFFPKLTGFFRALRRKKALQLSHAMAPKLYPYAGDPQMMQIKELSLGLFFLCDGCTVP